MENNSKTSWPIDWTAGRLTEINGELVTLGPGRVVNHPPNAEFFALGGCSVLYTLPDRPGQVLKVPRPYDFYIQAFEIEKRVYKRLGQHPNLLTAVEVNENGIYLERALYGCIRDYYYNGGDATREERIIWCRDIAKVLYYVHQNNIRHADLSGRNLLLNSKRQILLCDFCGSAIDNEMATVVAEHGFRHPNKDEYEYPTVRAELHSLGSTIYEIVTSAKPYKGDENGNNDTEAVIQINQKLADGDYPDISEVMLGDVIEKCWNGEFKSAIDVAEEIERLYVKLKELHTS